jgi:hypothetical protein
MRNIVIQSGVLAVAALLEVGGDAVIRAGLWGGTSALVLLGVTTLGAC